MTIQTAGSPLLLELPDMVDRGHTAVLVIDMQNDFCAPGGWSDRVAKRDIGRLGTIKKPIANLVRMAREAGVLVIWVRADYSTHQVPESMRARSERMGLKEDCCVPGTWGANWYGVEPEDGERIFTKHCYSAFSNVDLHSMLTGAGVRTLVFAGVQTHVCVESTLRDAHSLGYYCIVPADCVASPNVAAHEVMLSNVEMIFGVVVSLAELEPNWLPSTDGKSDSEGPKFEEPSGGSG